MPALPVSPVSNSPSGPGSATGAASATGSAASSGLRRANAVQPALVGLELPEAVKLPAARVRDAVRSARAEREAMDAADRRARRRYWSVRDLSRRLWRGRGYKLLRQMIRADVLPATRSTHSWWIANEDAAGLQAAFDDQAGKVRAFHGLETWLQDRCYVTPLTPELEALERGGLSVFTWRGQAYLPRRAWQVAAAPDGTIEYRHRSGAAVPAAPVEAEAQPDGLDDLTAATPPLTPAATEAASDTSTEVSAA